MWRQRGVQHVASRRQHEEAHAACGTLMHVVLTMGVEASTARQWHIRMQAWREHGLQQPRLASWFHGANHYGGQPKWEQVVPLAWDLLRAIVRARESRKWSPPDAQGP